MRHISEGIKTVKCQGSCVYVTPTFFLSGNSLYFLERIFVRSKLLISGCSFAYLALFSMKNRKYGVKGFLGKSGCFCSRMKVEPYVSVINVLEHSCDTGMPTHLNFLAFIWILDVILSINYQLGQSSKLTNLSAKKKRKSETKVKQENLASILETKGQKGSPPLRLPATSACTSLPWRSWRPPSASPGGTLRFCILSSLSVAGPPSWPPAVLGGPPAPTLWGFIQCRRNTSQPSLGNSKKKNRSSWTIKVYFIISSPWSWTVASISPFIC